MCFSRGETSSQFTFSDLAARPSRRALTALAMLLRVRNSASDILCLHDASFRLSLPYVFTSPSQVNIGQNTITREQTRATSAKTGANPQAAYVAECTAADMAENTEISCHKTQAVSCRLLSPALFFSGLRLIFIPPQHSFSPPALWARPSRPGQVAGPRRDKQSVALNPRGRINGSHFCSN